MSTSADTERAKVAKWLEELHDALKREKNFRSEGARFVSLYEGGERETNQFNILYANTETLGPALYNSTPRPEVLRRFKDEDPLGALAAKAGQRTLEYLLDNGDQQYAAYDDLLKNAVLEALVPGRGQIRFRYDSTISGEGEAQRVTAETVCGVAVPWNRFLHGYSTTWEAVPWVAYEHHMVEHELKKNFPDKAAQVTIESDDGDGDSSTSGDAEGKTTGPKPKLVQVYEIWDKFTRQVYFLTPNYPDGYLKVVPDPLGLSGFFDCPRPLCFFPRISSLVPAALYTVYEEQAKELNTVTVRINKLIRALKVRGFYDSTVEGIEKVLTAEDNTLIPVDNVAALLSQNGSLEKALWLAPIERLITVLQQLYTQRQQIKQVIYEITGIADIMRGTSAASETLGAQEIKNQWGTLRIKRFQKEVARYARDSLRILLEIAVSKLSPQTLRGMTGLQFPLAEEKQQLQGMLQQALAMGAPQEQLAQVQQQLSAPSWEDVLSLLQNDLSRSYRVDIETNSTVDAEATEDKQDIAELLNSLSQFLNGVAPLVMQGSLPFDAARAMLLAVARRYRFGTELEEHLKGMQPPKPPEDPAKGEAAAKAKYEQEKMQLELAIKQEELQLRRQQLALEAEYTQLKHALRMEEMQRQAANSQAAAQQARGRPTNPRGVTKS